MESAGDRLVPEQSRLERRRSHRKGSRWIKLVVALAVVLISGALFLVKTTSRPAGRVQSARQVTEHRSRAKARNFVVLVVSGTTPKSPLVKAVLIAVDMGDGTVRGLAVPGSAFMDVPGRGSQPLSQAYDEGPTYAVQAIRALTAVADTGGYLVVNEGVYSQALTSSAAAMLFSKSLASDMSPGGIIDLENSLSKAKGHKFTDKVLAARALTIGTERYFEVDRLSLQTEVRAVWGPDLAAKPAQGRVLILNGSGTPGIGAKAGDLLMGANLRIVDVRNAENFGYKTTLVYAYSDKSVAVANQVASLLKVGDVQMKPADQDITDVVVILGADFHP